MADIFISYAKADLPRVKPLAKALENEGWSVWWDRKITPGKNFSQTIEEAINVAKCMIVLWSNESVKSDWVQNEAAEGARRRVLVPALIDDVQIPFEFRRIQAADLIDWKAESIHSGFDILLSAISEIVGPFPLKVKEAGQKHEKEERKRRELKAERKPDKPEPAKIKPPEPRPDAAITNEFKSPEPRKTSNALKFGAVAIVIVLLIFGIWWWVSESQKKKLQIEVEREIEHILEQITLLKQTVSKTENLRQLNDLYKKSDALGRKILDIEQMSSVVESSQKTEKAHKSMEELSSLLITTKQKLEREERIRKAEEARKQDEAEAKRKVVEKQKLAKEIAHSQAKELSHDRPDSKLFGMFIVTMIPEQEVLSLTCRGLQVFSGVNADLYLLIDDLMERIIRIDRRQGSHYASTGMHLSDKTRVVIEFSGDAVYKPFIMHRSLASLLSKIDDSGECEIYLNIFSSDLNLIEHKEKDTSIIPELINVLLEDESVYYRTRAAEYLASIGDYSATKTLIAVMKQDKDPYIQACVAYALGDLGDITAIKALEESYDQYEKKSSYGYMFEAALKKLREKQ